ncbi:alpha/beta fold hydrolase [Dokdonia pacifica]|uniref:Pimeloyl-ACP methyl ester carboxylesterase n=1 Tax=Dokdonia pacifica TaxID=1627892 RepID=A0A239AP62_9FLAO|nr:alpha/beta hydrolase [Dokdonia pacifica]SNR97496.1 Pimeloyl-ACP methyl ester carboxylesterase [Dokdonia pacifica]
MNKKIVLLVIFSFVMLSVTTVYSQEEKRASDFAPMHQKVDISKYIGKKFRVSAHIRKETFNGNESVTIWTRINLKDSKSGVFNRDMGGIPVSKNWQKYSIEGILENENAQSLSFGLMCTENGDFFFDDFTLEIEETPENWVSIAIQNPGFEKAPEIPEQIWGDTAISKLKFYTASRTTQNPYKGTYALHIKGRGVYGQNDNQGGFIEVNGVKIYHEIYGEGEPLLLLHGAGQSIEAFKNQIDVFAKNYKVIAIDSRGRGRSTDNEQELTYMNQTEDMRLFMEKLNINSAHIVGWSDGGIIGLIMAMKYPEKVKKLVAMGANIHPDGLFPDRLEEHKKTLKRLESQNNPDYKIYIKLYKQLINYPQLQFEELTKIIAPTLIMAGDHDVIEDVHTVKMYQAIPNAYLAILPGETHWLPRDNPTLFNTTTLDFLMKEFKEPKRY